MKKVIVLLTSAYLIYLLFSANSNAVLPISQEILPISQEILPVSQEILPISEEKSTKCNCSAGGICICKGECTCTKSKIDLNPIYSKAIQDNQIVVLAVGCDIDLKNLPYKLVKLDNLNGENTGFIVGLPRNNRLNRIDLPKNTDLGMLKSKVQQYYYPITEDFLACPNCPTGRVRIRR